MKNKILLFLIIVIAPLLSYSQDFRFFPDEKSERLYSYDLINNGSYKPSTTYSDSLPVTKSEEFDALVANPSTPGFLVKSVEDKVFVGINHDTAVVESAYNYTISLKIWCVKYDDTGASPIEKDVTIVANYNPDSGKSYIDAGVFQFTGFHKIIAEITDVYDNNAHATVARSSLPKNFYIMSTIRTERYDNQAFSVYPWSSAINNGSTLHITWTPSQGSYSCTNSASLYDIKPIEYDLEWTYVDDYTYNIYNNGMSGTPGYAFTSSSNIDYDFRKNSTRIRVLENHYDLPIVYEHGAIVFRIRAVRPNPDSQYKSIIYGNWTLPDNGTANLAYQCQAYFVTTAHDTDKLNWQYTINFAEDGKYKHVIKYYDGALKERQTQTKINTDSAYVITVDKIYDHEGRIGIQTLPIPFIQANVLYSPNIIYNAQTNQPYKSDDFDNLSCALPDSIPPFSSNSLANKYYSSLNPDKAGVQKFVPDAKGYPFVQSIYSPDNLLSWQGSAGLDHQLWRGHGTRYEYMRATQNEMIGLFGYEAGSYEYYPKEVITDANGQSSFIIQNKSGQTVASGLIAMIDTANIPITALPNATSGFQSCFDIIAGGEQYQQDNTLSVSNPFYNESSGNNSLTYALTMPAFPLTSDNCTTNYIWTKAYYDFSATDECGRTVIAGTPGVLGADSVLASNTPDFMLSSPTPSWLAQGKYIATKQLSFSTDEIKGQVQDYVSAHEPTCFHDDKYFIRQTVEAASFPCLDSSNYDECDAKKRQMMSELWPGAKYGWYNKNSDGSFSNADSSGYWHFTVGDTSAYSLDHYWYPTIFRTWQYIYGQCTPIYYYNDTTVHCNTTLSSISVHHNGRLYTNLDKLPIDTFIAIFNDTVAEALLPLHPEYCKLSFCNDFAYADALQRYQTASEGEMANRFFLDSIINHDPLYYNGAPSDTARIRKQLSHFLTDSAVRLDQYAISQAYCSAGNSLEYAHSKKFVFSNDILNLTFQDSAVKQKYFSALIAAYIGTRSAVLQKQIDATVCSCKANDTVYSFDCSGDTLGYGWSEDPRYRPWDENLWVIGSPVFPPTYQPTAWDMTTYNVELPDWIQNVFDDANDSNSDHSSLATPPLQIQDSIDADNAIKISANLDYIMDKLANCSETSSKLTQIRAGLLSYCNTHGLDSLTPQAVMNVITDPAGANIPLSDLCNPFLLPYNVYDNSFDKEYTYDCGDPTLYTGVMDLLNTSVVNSVIKSAVVGGSTVSSLTLTSANAYERKIASYLSVSNSATISIQSALDTIKYVDPSNSLNIKIYKYVHLKFFAGGADTLGLYIKRKAETLAELDTVTGTINIDTAFCLNDDPDALITGYVGKSTAVLDMTIDGTLKGRYYVWSNGINIMTDLSDETLVKCISCISMKSALDAFKADKATYGYDDAYNHPLFQSVLTNYLNYKLHKNHSYAEYNDLMNGCAITDMTTLNHHWAPILVTLVPGDTSGFISGLRAYTDRNLITRQIYYPGLNKTEFAIDLSTVPDDSLVNYVDRINLLAATGVSYLPDRPLMVFDRSTCSPGTPLSTYMSPSTSSSVYVYINGVSYPYTLYQYSGTYSTPKQHADILAGIDSYVLQCPGSFTMGDAELLRSDDYSTSDKQNYLTYVYGLPVTSSYQIADSISPANLKARVSSFTGTLSYDDPHCSNNKRDLYIFDPSQNSNGGYTILTTILGYVKSTLGSNHLFPAAGNISTTGSVTGLMIYQKSDGVAWYRYFTSDNKLYNVHIAPPANPPFGINTLVYDSLQVGPGLDSIFNFTVFMHYSSVPSSVIACKGYTNFPLGYGRKVANVVLYNKSGNNICLDSVDCEYNQLQDAIASGRLMYQQYYDSLTTAVSDSMLAFLLRNVKDSLSLCTQYRKNQITRYYHDLAGNLERTVPPSDYDNNPFTPQKASYYYYNSQNQIIKQKTPDGGTTNFFYDPAGKVVFSQNSKQRPNKNYSYTLYDKQERIIETGEVKLDCGGVCNEVSSSEFTSMDTLVKFVQSHTRYDVVKTFYDTAVTALSSKTGYKLSDQENLLGRVSAIFYYRSKSADYNSSTVAEPQVGTYHSYDMMGNVKTVTYSCLALQPVRQQYKRIDYDYDQISGKVNMISYNRGFGDQFFCQYSYDADNRITEVQTSRDGIIWNRDAAYTYYKHGPLANLKIGDDQLQSIDYAYTIQGWLKAINGDVLRPDKDMGNNGASGDRSYARDAMAMTLNYFANDYKAIDNSVTVTNLPEPAKNLYNGNIAQQTLSVASIGSLQRTYQYDQVQRLKLATYGTVNENALTVASPSNIFKNSYDYDADGNIQSLVRYDNTGTLMDSLQYTYAPASNMLQLVQDQVAGPTTPAFDIETPTYTPDGGINYKYDSIGNMVRDIYNNQKVVWDVYGKVRCIIDTVTNDILFYDYDGAGNRIRKEIVSKTTGEEETHRGEYYVNDASGNLLATYKQNSKFSTYGLVSAANSGQQGNSEFIPFLLSHLSQFNFEDRFRDTAITNEPGWWASYQSSRGLSFYLHDHDLFESFMQSGAYLSDLWSFDVSQFYPAPREGIFTKAMIAADYDDQPIFDEILNFSTEGTALFDHLDTWMSPGDMMNMWIMLGLNPAFYDGSGTTSAHSSNAAGFYSYVSSSSANKATALSMVMDLLHNDILANNANNAQHFYQDVMWDNSIFNSTNLRNPTNPPLTTFETAVSDMMAAYSDDGSIDPFVITWAGAGPWLNMNTTDAQRFDIAYNIFPATMIQDFLTNASNGNDNLDHAIASVDRVNGLMYTWWIKSDTILGPNVSMDVFDGVAEDTLMLAEQHIYGSSKLAVQYFDDTASLLKDRVKNTYNADGTIVPMKDLEVQRPWYSRAYDDLIRYNQVDPWGNGNTDDISVYRRIGKKWFTMADHLGNVTALVQDRKSGHKANPTDLTYDYWLANLAEVSDYYPFGMKMPGRLTLSNNKHGYNGQRAEKDMYASVNPALGDYDVHYQYKFREYDPRIGRFWSVDPLAGKYPYNSPYNFAEDRVIDGQDLEGLEYSPASATAGGGRDNTAVITVPSAAQIQAIKEAKARENYKLPAPQSVDVDYSRTSYGSSAGKAYAEALIQQEAALVPGATIGIKVLKQEPITKMDYALEAIGFLPFGEMGEMLGRGVGRATEFIRTHEIVGNASSKGVGEYMKMMKAGEKIPPIEVFESGGRKYVLNGHHRLEAATRLGKDIEYIKVDIDRVKSYGYKDAEDLMQHSSSAPRNRLNNKIVNKAAGN